MEAIAQAYLERGDAASALPILSTLALASASSAEQRRRRLLHSRIHREATAVLACLQARVALSPEQQAAVCDAVLDRDLPTAVFFGEFKGSEATKRLHKLRLAVHPEKCTAAKAAAAVTKLHERKEEHEARAAEDLRASASPVPEPANLPPSTSISASVPPVRLSRPFPASSSPLSRTTPTRAQRGDQLTSLLSGLRSNSGIKLQSDLSLDGWQSMDSSLEQSTSRGWCDPPAEASSPILEHTIVTEFDRLRGSLLESLAARAACDEPTASNFAQATLSEALSSSYTAQSSVTVTRRWVKPSGVLPVLQPKRAAKQ